MARLEGKFLKDFFVQEAPSGTINGSNVTFTLGYLPMMAQAVFLFIDGTLLRQGSGLDYTLSTQTLTLAAAPTVGQTLWAIYIKERG
jgi:hypothetical protein